jgi:hypothetical protein
MGTAVTARKAVVMRKMLVIQLTREKGILLNIAGKKRATCSNQYDHSVADVDKNGSLYLPKISSFTQACL